MNPEPPRSVPLTSRDQRTWSPSGEIRRVAAYALRPAGPGPGPVSVPVHVPVRPASAGSPGDRAGAFGTATGGGGAPGGGGGGAPGGGGGGAPRGGGGGASSLTRASPSNPRNHPFGRLLCLAASPPPPSLPAR